jgi:hypothetical protein
VSGGIDLRGSMRRSTGTLPIWLVVWVLFLVLATVQQAPARADRPIQGRTRAGGESHHPGSVDGVLRPGARVQIEGLGVIAPEPGNGVWAAALQPDGGMRVLGVETLPDGAVVIRRGPAMPAGEPEQGSACDDNAYTLYGESWQKTFKWYFNRKSAPSEVDEDNASEALQDAVDNITGADNNCDLADRVSATNAFQGVTGDSVNIGTDSTCLGSDGKSIMGFGNLLASNLALTCWWTSNGNIVEADTRFNKTEFLWVVNLGDSCVYKFVVEAVATHEVGHSFGLGHVSEVAHGTLTMSTTIMACQQSERTLGLGDVRGLEALY